MTLALSLINYSAYVTLGQDLDTGYQPFMENASGEDMGALGQVTCTFTINKQLFTQSFIVCRHMQRPVILGTDFTSTNFVGVTVPDTTFTIALGKKTGTTFPIMFDNKHRL